jgi:hypothetical protein
MTAPVYMGICVRERDAVMEERRKNKRMDMSSKLLLKSLNQGEEPQEVSINVINVSKTGVGFTCEHALELGTVYESFLTIWTKEVLHAFLEIIRKEKVMDDLYEYGAIFIGMSETDASRIETYGTIHDMET